MLALHENPPIAYPQDSCLDEITGRWWVAHTRANHEKALAFDLLERGIAYFLPMVEKTRLIRRRRFRSLSPIFPGYLFFAGDDEARYQALNTHRIAHALDVADQQRLIEELSQIERALASRTRLDPFPYLKKGKRCRIRSGPLQGIEGVVLSRRGITHLVLQVELLGQAVATQIDPSLVEPND